MKLSQLSIMAEHSLSVHSSECDVTKRKPSSIMRVFVSYKNERTSLDVSSDEKVGEIREIVRDLFEIGPDDGPAGVEMQEKRILTLTYAGADLNNAWILADLGISSGSTLKAVLREEIKPTIYIHTVFNDDIVPMLDKINFRMMRVEEFRSLVSQKIGLPVGLFRLLNKEGVEMFDMHGLDTYNLDLGDTVRMETWDGWNDFLNLAIMGFASHMMDNLSSEEIESRYQMKVALYIAAHFGHVDLAVSLLRLGIRADEPVGIHPSRLWCRTYVDHIDNKKAPVHVAAAAGQLGVLRSFVHHNVCNVLAKDGNDLTPLNISLRKKQKACASFLLTKQWSKINYNKKHSMPLSIYVKMKRWCDKARDRTYVFQGQFKSSLKNPRRNIMTGALVGNGVQLDGFSKSKMSSKPAAIVRAEEEYDKKKKKRLWNFDDDGKDPMSIHPSTYFKSLSQMQSLKFPRLSKWGKMMGKAMQEASEKEEPKQHENTEPKVGFQDSQARNQLGIASSSETNLKPVGVKLPPIKGAFVTSTKNLSQSHHNLTAGSKDDLTQSPRQNVHKTGVVLRGGTQSRTATSTPTKTGSVCSQSMSESQHSKPKETLNVFSTGDTPSPQKPKKKHREPSLKTLLVSKARTGDPLMPLPMVSKDNSPRPFVDDRNLNLTKGTLKTFQKHRGMQSRDYAIKCLSVANSFRDKPWLQQVHQAMAIAARGVKKVVDRQPHLFAADISKGGLSICHETLSVSQETGLSESDKSLVSTA